MKYWAVENIWTLFHFASRDDLKNVHNRVLWPHLLLCGGLQWLKIS